MHESGEVYPSEVAGIGINRQVFTPRSGRIGGGVLLLHGLGDHIGCHVPAAEIFCRRDFLCVGIDWPGHGYSDGRRGDIDGVAGASSLIGEARAHLESLLPPGTPLGMYAHSTGALFALDYVSEQGQVADSTLFDWIWLSSPLLRPDYGQHPLKKKGAKLLAKLAPRLVLDTGVRPKRCRHIDAEQKIQEKREGDRDLCHHLVSARLGADLLAHGAETNDRAATIRDPMRLLITQGADDTICPPIFSRDFFDHVSARDKTYALLPGMLHEPLREPDNTPLIEVVENWLDSGKGAAVPR